MNICSHIAGSCDISWLTIGSAAIKNTELPSTRSDWRGELQIVGRASHEDMLPRQPVDFFGMVREHVDSLSALESVAFDNSL